MKRSLLALALLALAFPAAARAQQPLSSFVEAAHDHAFDLREAIETREQSRSQVDESRARLLPSFTASAGYTRFEYAIQPQFPNGSGGFTTATIQPIDQLQATFTLSVPLVDVGAWLTFFSSEATADAASDRAEASRIDVEVAVVQAYYQLVAARAVVAQAQAAVATAEENLAVATSRGTAGIASELDVERARTDVERARQTAAEATLNEALAVRNLVVLTGLTPSDDASSLDDDLHAEAPLERFVSHLDQHPSVRAAEHDREAAQRLHDAAWAGLFPTLGASASERVTNASGFGQPSLWQVGLTLSWTLDFGRVAQVQTRDHGDRIAAIREERSEAQVETAVYEAWHRVQSLASRAQAARAAEVSSERAASVASARFGAGTGSALEVSQAQRDLLLAQVQRIQADADLRVAREVLRLRAGLPLGGEP
ncbi:MAG: TolC family protein [Sandaracinus sp.]